MATKTLEDDGKPLSGEVQSLTRGLRILEHVVEADAPVRLRDIAHAFGIDRSVALRFLATLEKSGYVSKNQAEKTYARGPRVDRIGRSGLQERLLAAASPMISLLAEETGQAVHLAVLKGQKAILVEAVQASGVISIRQSTGDREPLHSSSVGKALLAFATDEERQKLMAELDYTPLTARTIASAANLERELEIVRAEGVAFDEGEGDLQVNCLAAPIFWPEGRVVGAIGLSMVAAIYPQGPREMKSWIDLTRKAAGEIGQRLAS
jgi:DNA-binding IclR family transcriptional regulator